MKGMKKKGKNATFTKGYCNIEDKHVIAANEMKSKK